MFFQSLPLRKLITIPFIILIIITILFTASISLVSSIKSVELIVDELISEIREEIENELYNFMKIPLLVNDINHSNFTNDIIDTNDKVKRERYFSSKMQLFPDLVMNFYGNESGFFYGARRNAEFQIEVVENDNNTNGSSVYYSIDDSGKADKFVREFPNFDCRTRPWYKTAVLTNDSRYTEIYKHFVFDDLAVTASKPYYRNGEFQGVFGSDLLLGSINNFLSELSISKNAEIFITDPLYLVANSSGNKNFLMEESVIKRLKPEDVYDKNISRVYSNIKESAGSKKSAFFIESFTFRESGLNWEIFIFVPKSIFYNRIYRGIIFTAVVCLVILLISSGCGIFISGLILHPVSELVRFSEKISHGEWDFKVETYGSNEIGKLQHSFEMMAEKIKYSITNLEQIVEQKAATVMLEREQLVSLFDGIPEPIFVSDKSTYEILYANTAFKNTFGSVYAEKKCYEFIQNGKEPCTFCSDREFFDSNAPYYWQVYNECVNKHYYLIERSINWQDRSEAKFQLGIDITALKMTEKALIESENELVELNAVKDKFFSIIAHDLKNPFNAILGFSELLLGDYYEEVGEEMREVIKMIYDSAGNAYKLLENLLEWSRSQTGKLLFNREIIDISEIVSACLGISFSQAMQKGIVLSSEINGRLEAYADNNTVTTVVRNLISNAIKFTGKGGHIVVRGEISGDVVKVSVEDSGVGMSEEIKSKIFKISEKVSFPGTNDETGTGLGLLLCKEFVEKNGGIIYAESEAGKGSVFTFELPGSSQGLSSAKSP